MKFENVNFSNEILEVINSYQPLAEWFKRNEFSITYFGFQEQKYEFAKEDGYYSKDLLVLRDMMAISLLWLNSKYEYTKEEKALKAAIAISKIYKMNIEKLSNSARQSFDIYVNGISQEYMEDALNPPDLIDLEIEYLKQKKVELEEEMNNVDCRLSQLQENKRKGVK